MSQTPVCWTREKRASADPVTAEAGTGACAVREAEAGKAGRTERRELSGLRVGIRERRRGARGDETVTESE